MNRKFALLFFVCALSFTTVAQKIEENVLDYEYTQKPMSPLDGMKSYDFVVETPYPENNDGLIAYAKKKHAEAVADHPNKLAEEEARFQESLASYDDDVALAQENYRLEQEAFSQLSKLERLAAESHDRPQLRMPSKPTRRVLHEPVYREPDTRSAIVFKPAVLADSYLVIEGFEKGSESALIGDVILNDFEAGEMVTDVKEISKYNSTTKQSEKVKVYSYSIPWKRPTSLRLEYNGEVLYDGIFGNTGDFTTKTSDRQLNRGSLEKSSVTMILSEIKQYINDQYGYAKVPSQFVARTPKNKGDYDDLEKAGKMAVKGINPLGSSDGVSELAEAMATWEKALTELDVNDKKARINAKIGKALHLNLIEAYIFQEKFVKAEDQLAQLRDMELKKDEERMVDGYVNRISDRKERG